MAPHDPSKKLNIVIVGGSLGGLSTGIALKSLGHDCTILERNPTSLLHNQGAGIVAGGDTLAFFKTYDRCKRQLAVRSERRQYFNRSGEVVHKEDMVQNMTSWDLTYYLMRANFDGVRSEYCEVPEPVSSDGIARHLHNHRVVDIKERGDQVEVFYESTNKDGGEEHGSILTDLVVGADGPSSTVRSIFVHDVKRSYAGYCALRGTVPEEEVTERTREAFSQRFSFFHAKGIQILAYLIPGENGTVKPGRRLINFVYYSNFPEGGPLEKLMTDVDGYTHHNTIAPGKIDPRVWEEQKQIAREELPPQFAEIVCATKKPFAQAVTDVVSPWSVFMDGKVCLIGDALAGFRPHTVASTSQATFNAMSLASYVAGEISSEQWIRETMQFSRYIQKRGVDMGTRSQFEDLPMQEHVHDRNVASTPREKEVFPPWTWTKEDEHRLSSRNGVKNGMPYD